jgi:hypothetical protein
MKDANRLGRAAYRQTRKEGAIRPTRRRFDSQYPFEVWLSQLAQDLPHLREQDNRRNFAEFAALRDSIVAVVDADQRRALARAPSWLFELLSVWHAERATVITFNYDTMVESGVESSILPLKELRITDSNSDLNPMRRVPKGWAQRALSLDILLDQPPAVAGPHGLALADSFRLLKLHGSIDWWQAPNDTSGATLNRWGNVSPFGPIHLSLPVTAQGKLLPGRERFIVPPLAIKSPYYTAPLVHQLWRDAYAALSQARRLTLIGYSLPIADLVAAGMLESAMTAWKGDVSVEVVDKSPEPVLERLAAIGSPPVEIFGDPRCVARYAETACLRASSKIAIALRAVEPPDEASVGIVVNWSAGDEPRSANVVGWERNHQELLLRLDTGGLAFQHQMEGYPTIRQLADAVRQSATVSVKIPARATLPIVDVAPLSFRSPYQNSPLNLYAAGRVESDK